MNSSDIFREKIKKIDGADSGIDADLVDGVQKDLLGIGGDGYSWVDETANRDSDTNYTNDNGKPILFCITTEYDTDNTTSLHIDDIVVSQINGGGTSQTSSTISIADGSTYKCKGSIYKWFELK